MRPTAFRLPREDFKTSRGLQRCAPTCPASVIRVTEAGVAVLSPRWPRKTGGLLAQCRSSSLVFLLTSRTAAPSKLWRRRRQSPIRLQYLSPFVSPLLLLSSSSSSSVSRLSVPARLHLTQQPPSRPSDPRQATKDHPQLTVARDTTSNMASRNQLNHVDLGREWLQVLIENDQLRPYITTNVQANASRHAFPGLRLSPDLLGLRLCLLHRAQPCCRMLLQHHAHRVSRSILGRGPSPNQQRRCGRFEMAGTRASAVNIRSERPSYDMETLSTIWGRSRPRLGTALAGALLCLPSRRP
ncbi:hypothetical protein B0T17DRAFT_149391 [Bombardia bombarda]|uniref:Uncharacterized protein n=1 Tax=Bombardia bombarda TaxID=252184 RepID=A0AA39X711_9PEZI|nr:hypothetical protein B0T17DRAFT_149391 [Bombardia bombarda]